MSINADGQGREAGGRRGSCCCRSFNAILQVTAWANQDESARSERRCGGNIKLNLEQREGETRQHTFLVNREMETMLWGSFMRERE